MVKIVVSESEARGRHALQRALCGEGYAVRTASGRKETASLVEGFVPDVVLLDMHRSVAMGHSPVGQIFLHHDRSRESPVVFFAPAAYAAAGRIWTPSLACCADGGLFGTLPDHIRNKTLAHVRRVCLSLARCKHMMTDAMPSGYGRQREALHDAVA